MKVRRLAEISVPIFKASARKSTSDISQQLQDAGHIFEDAGRAAISFAARTGRWSMISSAAKSISILSNAETHPDMTIRRPDGSWIFHFVNVIDDIEMKISHVIRGEDHLSNTPKHIELFRALGATPPRFAHIPLILNRDGSKMSKRDQGASVDYLHSRAAICRRRCAIIFACSVGRRRTIAKRSRSKKSCGFSI